MRKKTDVRAISIGFLFCVVLGGCGSREEIIPFVSPVPEATYAPVSTEETAAGEPQEICVYICGAVEAPGVVLLPEGSRAVDAVAAAGGLTEDAAETSVNLAQRLEDSQMLYIPTEAEAAADEAMHREEEAGLININTADAETLCTLPGIGETRANAIIAYREQNGPFSSVEDIMQVSGIKENLYGQFCDRITVK